MSLHESHYVPIALEQSSSYCFHYSKIGISKLLWFLCDWIKSFDNPQHDYYMYYYIITSKVACSCLVRY